MSPGARTAQPTAPATIKNIVIADRYELRMILGSGATGITWAATDLDTLTEVAVKLARNEGNTFAHESHLQAAVTSPYVPRVLDAGEVQLPGQPGPVAYMVQELIEGANLRDLLKTLAPHNVDVTAWAYALLRALKATHRTGIVHRDVKPSNILIPMTRSGLPSPQAKLTDFGTAALTDQWDGHASSHGTVLYMSPEQAHGASLTPASDIYSLGLVLLECLTGSRAFNFPSIESLVARTIRQPAIPDSLPTSWQTLLRSMTSLDPDTRPTATDALDMLTRQPSRPETLPLTNSRELALAS